MPIDVITGAHFDCALDGVLDGPVPVELHRYYDSRWRSDDRGLGLGHRHGFEHWLVFDLDGITHRGPDGHERHFPHLEREGQRASKAGFTLVCASAGRYVLTHRAHRTLVFRRPHGAFEAELAEIVDRRGADDPRAYRLAFQYEAGQLSKILAPHDQTLKLDWTADGHLHGVQYWPRGGERTWLVRYTYEGGYLVEGIDAYAKSFRIAYDASGRLARRTDRRGYSFLFTYDAEGRCIAGGGEDGVRSVQLTYRPLEHETRVLDANGGEWIHQYTSAGVVALITDPYGGTRYLKPGDDGRVLVEYDAQSAPTRYVHDAAGAPIAKITPAGEHIGLNGDAPALRGHRVPRTVRECEWGDFGEAEFALPDPYEVLPHLPSEVRTSLVTSDDPRRGHATPIHDLHGLLLRAEREDGATRSYGYTENGGLRRATDFDGGTWRLEHASWNHVVRQVDPVGAITEYAYSATEKLVRVIDPAGVQTDYVYDLADRLVELRRGGPVRERFVYDKAGHLVEKRDGSGELLIAYTRDLAGRTIRRALASGDEHAFAYEGTRLVEARTQRHRCTFGYDARGHRVADLRGELGVEHRYVHDFLTETIVLGRFRIDYQLERDGSVVIVDPTGARTRLRYLRRGLFLREIGEQTRELVQLDPRGAPLVKVAWTEGGARWERRYRYSGEGDLREAFDSAAGLTRFVHDGAHRLVGVERAEGRRETYAYNKAGALHTSPSLGQGTIGELNQLRYAQGESFTYNGRHHLAAREGASGRWEYDYDSRDLLTGAFWRGPDGRSWGWEQEHDALGRRVLVRPGYRDGAQFYWDTDRIAAEVFADGAVRVYVFADPFAVVPLGFVDYESLDADPASGRRYELFTDQRGCPVEARDRAGEVVWKASVDPYGAARIETGADFHQPLRMPGHYWDRETGLHDNRFRTYWPELGRYLQSDPWDLAGGLYLYGYTRSPLAEVDVRGLDCTRVAIAGSGETPPEGGPEHPATPDPGAGTPGRTPPPTPEQRALAAAHGNDPAQVAARRQLANHFYEQHGQKWDRNIDAVRPLTDEEIRSELACIDFDHPVHAGPPPPAPTSLSQWQPPKGRRGGYFAPEGTPTDALGIGPQGKAWNVPGAPVMDKVSTHYGVDPETPYLQSTAAPAEDSWSVPGTMQPSTGGGTQVYVPAGHDLDDPRIKEK